MPSTYLQSYWSDAKHNKAFEQRLGEPGTGGFLTHDDRTQLTMISDENQLTTAENDWNHTLWLCGLCALVNQY